MAYAFVQDVPVSAEMYEQIRGKFGSDTPKGLVTHIALKRDGGLRYVDVWETQEDWQRFHDDTVFPAVVEVLAGYGLEPDPALVTFTEVDVVDVWK